jgi:hypothetical protein
MKISPSGATSRFAGTGEGGYWGDGGLAALAKVGDPRGIAVDASVNVFILQSSTSGAEGVSGGHYHHRRRHGGLSAIRVMAVRYLGAPF